MDRPSFCWGQGVKDVEFPHQELHWGWMTVLGEGDVPNRTVFPATGVLFLPFQESISLGKILTNVAICLRGDRSRKPLQENLSENSRLLKRGFA